MEYFFAGTYSEPILFGTGEVFQGKGKGVYFCSFDGRQVSILAELPLRNPSFLCVDEARKKIYAVNELKEYAGAFGGGVSELDYTDDGTMTFVRSYNTGGTDPCHIVVSPNGELLAISNFASGSLAVFPLAEDGTLLPDRQFFQHEGSSIHPVRQRGPHAHSAIFLGEDTLLVPDLGLDQVVAYRHANGQVTENPEMTLQLPAGSGPRYGELSPDGEHFYLINEIASSVTHFALNNGRLIAQETVNTLPDDFTGDNICSDLHITPDGRHLYASNRGHDSITVYQIGEQGELHFLQRVSCGGKTPRNFAVSPSGGHLLVGNQSSDNVVVFRIENDGRLEPISDISFPTPVCIQFLKGLKA